MRYYTQFIRVFGFIFIFVFPIGAAMSVQEVSSNKGVAVFAGGCFWCMQQAFDELDGVESTQAGYSGGLEPNPSYEQVSSGATGHIESVKVIYDTNKLSYEELLAHFWVNIDPTVKNRQFCDVGRQYRSVIFFHNEAQKGLAQSSLKRVHQIFEYPVYTELLPFTEFYPAEEYHQNYYKKNPIRYNYYKFSCGRKSRLESLWTQDLIHKLKEVEGSKERR